ncbi:MAG: 50S ribosomal protein L31 [Gammaproteobacteria bacterium]|nr:50S ribosomal protein L31 [Gammaproteobacteria bacterium]
MKASIHPEYKLLKVTCSCGNVFETASTITSGALGIEVCQNCHPFYTGRQKTDQVGGRAQRFRERYGMKAVVTPEPDKE